MISVQQSTIVTNMISLSLHHFHSVCVQYLIMQPTKSIDMLYKNTLGVKKSEAKSEAPVTLHVTKRSDIR